MIPTRILTSGLLWAASLAAPATLQPQSLVVVNKSDHEAMILDAATFAVRARLPTGFGPHEVVAAPDGRTAYVANYGLVGVFQPAGSGAREEFRPGNSITVLDLVERKVKTTFDLGEFSKPHGLALSRDGSRLWVTCEGAQALVELDARTGALLRSWKTGQRGGHMVVAAPDERTFYIASIESGTLAVLDAATGGVEQFPVGARAEALAVTPDGREVWVGNTREGTLQVLDSAARRVVAIVSVFGRFPLRIRFTPDGRQAWVTVVANNSVAVFDVASLRLVDNIELDGVPLGLALSPDGRRAFVTVSTANHLAVLDVATRKLLQYVPVGREPDGLAFVPATADTASGRNPK
jgi:YVTN family beta-propeller protein